MKIGLFSETYVPTTDGVATYVASMEKELRDMGHEPHVFTCGDKYEDIGNVHKAPSMKFPFYEQYRVAFPLRFIRKVDELGLDIVHIHAPFGIGLMGFIAAKQLKLPTVATLHTYFIEMCKGFKGVLASERGVRYAWLYNLKLYEHCNITTTPTDKMRKILVDDWKFKKEVRVVWNGTDTNVFRPDRRDVDVRKALNITSPYIATYIGRVTADKGVDTLVDAVAILLKKGIDITLVVAGIGPAESAIAEQIRHLGIEEHTRKLGFIDMNFKTSLLTESDVFVLASKADTFGISLIEAMASGTPTIGARSGGIPEVIQDGDNGLLVEYGNKEQLADKIEALLTDPQLSDGLIERGRRFVVDKCSIRKSIGGFVDIYEYLISHNPA